MPLPDSPPPAPSPSPESKRLEAIERARNARERGAVEIEREAAKKRREQAKEQLQNPEVRESLMKQIAQVRTLSANPAIPEPLQKRLELVLEDFEKLPDRAADDSFEFAHVVIPVVNARKLLTEYGLLGMQQDVRKAYDALSALTSDVDSRIGQHAIPSVRPYAAIQPKVSRSHPEAQRDRLVSSLQILGIGFFGLIGGAGLIRNFIAKENNWALPSAYIFAAYACYKMSYQGSGWLNEHRDMDDIMDASRQMLLLNRPDILRKMHLENPENRPHYVALARNVFDNAEPTTLRTTVEDKEKSTDDVAAALGLGKDLPSDVAMFIGDRSALAELVTRLETIRDEEAREFTLTMLHEGITPDSIPPSAAAAVDQFKRKLQPDHSGTFPFTNRPLGLDGMTQNAA